ncbi:glycosyltransferase [Methylomonas sp. LL1]|uniref:glycosyltransferase family 2 protein n=1 Tax=Methylomonas sp. LL1 TaxID=2785785 RepID=UPI0018C3F00E|nr:glycosyltransferase [Methylomonas sp. LL1]QPK64918.1 glycosyltransferase [Methylomonas sp. LL1]
MVNATALLTIGLPVHNGDVFLRAALDSILGQRFKDFIILVSDNASTDNTHEIAKEFELRDCRIKYIRQDRNLGAVENFLFVARDIRTPYFMWFACDDVMAPDFLETCINALETNPNVGMAFTGIRNIDSLGRSIREYPNLIDFSGMPTWRTISRYLLSPEVFGKANLIYSVYRTPVVTNALAHYGLPLSWGGDMSFVLAAIVQAGVVISSEILFYKRWVREDDSAVIPLQVEIETSVLNQSCPLEHYQEYEEAMISAVAGSRFEFLTAFLMKYRRQRLMRMKRATEEDFPVQSGWVQWKGWITDVYRSGLDAFTILRGITR